MRASTSFATFVLSTLCLLGVAAPAALAQQTSDTPDPLVTAAKDVARAFKRQAQRDPLVRSGLTLPEPQVTLETTRGKGTATGSIGLVKQNAGGETTLGFVITTPIGDSPDAEARPLDLRGVGNGAKIAFNVSGSRLFKTFSVMDIVRFCTERSIAKENCTAGKLEDVDPGASQGLLDLAFQSVPVLYGASFTYGRNKFSFYDAAGARQNPETHSDVQAEGSLGLLVNRRRDLLAFHVAYGDTFNASPSKTQLCRPLTGSTVLRCDAATIGGPVEEQSLIGTIEYRWQKRGDSAFPVAFAPKFQFSLGLDDDTEDLTSFEAPFYVFQEKPKTTTAAPKLNGGVSAGWRSDSGFQVSVFIGTTFSLFKM